jgi:hypothetical protein
MVVNAEWVRIWKDAVVACLKISSRYSSGWNQESHGKPL